MLDNRVSKTVTTGNVIVLQIDGTLKEFTAGQTVLMTAWDAVVYAGAGLVS